MVQIHHFNMIIIKQDYPSLFSWQQLSKIIDNIIIFIIRKRLCNYLKIVNNLISVEIIADFEIPQSTRDQRDDILYQPSRKFKIFKF